MPVERKHLSDKPKRWHADRRLDAARYDAARYDAARYDATWYDAAGNDAARKHAGTYVPADE